MDLGGAFSARTKRRSALGFGRELGEDWGEYLKGQTCGARFALAKSRAAVTARARVLPGHEVGDGSDIWAPRVGVPGTRDLLVSGRRKGRGAASGCSTVGREESWAARGKGEGKKEQAVGEGKEDWAEPKSSERDKFFSFLFSVSLFFLNKTHFKTTFEFLLNFSQNHSSQ